MHLWQVANQIVDFQMLIKPAFIYFINNLLKCKNWPITKSIYDAYRIDDRNNSTNEVMKRIYGKLQIKLLISKC